jgi:hypothetical protein
MPVSSQPASGTGGPAVKKSAIQLSAWAASVRQKNTDRAVRRGDRREDGLAAPAREDRSEQPLGAPGRAERAGSLDALAAMRGPGALACSWLTMMRDRPWRHGCTALERCWQA